MPRHSKALRYVKFRQFSHLYCIKGTRLEYYFIRSFYKSFLLVFYTYFLLLSIELPCNSNFDFPLFLYCIILQLHVYWIWICCFLHHLAFVIWKSLNFLQQNLRSFSISGGFLRHLSPFHQNLYSNDAIHKCCTIGGFYLNEQQSVDCGFQRALWLSSNFRGAGNISFRQQFLPNNHCDFSTRSIWFYDDGQKTYKEAFFHCFEIKFVLICALNAFDASGF